MTNYPFLFLPHHLDHLEATKSVLEMLQLTSPLVCCYDTLMLTRLIEKSKGVYAVISLRKEQLQEIDSKLFFYRLNENKNFIYTEMFPVRFCPTWSNQGNFTKVARDLAIKITLE